LEFFKAGSESLGGELEDVVDFEDFFGGAGVKFFEIVFFNFADVGFKMVFDINGVVSRVNVEFIDDVVVGRGGEEARIGQYGGSGHGKMRTGDVLI
jgi:hypothetical protein